MKIFIDTRMKKIYKDYFKAMGYEVLEINKNHDVYEEISSHVDVFMCKINEDLIVAPNIATNLSGIKYISGENVENSYPNTVKYNVCVSKKFAICNSKYISKILLEILKKKNLNIIDVNQGYARCTTIPLKDDSFITSDVGIKKELEKRGIDVLYLQDEDIKLINEDGTYSKMSGFIGGATCILDDKIILFGDSNKLKYKDIFINYIASKGYTLVDFKNEDIIDYGSCVIYKEGDNKIE